MLLSDYGEMAEQLASVGVLILVFLDVTLWWVINLSLLHQKKVLILVFLDVTLWFWTNVFNVPIWRCLNPCFSGCYSLMQRNCGIQHETESLNPCFSGCYSLMQRNCGIQHETESLNPCFSGCYSLIMMKMVY